MELSRYPNVERFDDYNLDVLDAELPPQHLREVVQRPQRWDQPFAAGRLTADFVSQILNHPVLREIDASVFPQDLALVDIIANDARPLQLRRGERLYRQGDYGTSMFVVLHGGFVDITDPILGVAEALTRRPRETTPIAATDDTIVLEIRWAGARELRQWSEWFRGLTDQLHRAHALYYGIRNCDAFVRLSDAHLDEILRHARLESYGQFEWSHAYRKARSNATPLRDHEPIIADEDEYLDEIIVMVSGFARVTSVHGAQETSIGAIGAGQVGGLLELLDASGRPDATDAGLSFANGYRVSGTAIVVRVPTYIFEDMIFPSLSRSHMSAFIADVRNASCAAVSDERNRRHRGPPPEIVVDRRLMNGTQAMAIDLDRCVNCDECVRACADSHGGVSRFVRRGDTLANVLIAHACMHCHDPVCMIGCPTGAINRQPDTGHVTVNEDLCIGCTICASTCPYDNIRMEPALSAGGRPLVGDDGAPVLTAIKCDLCYKQRNGPACQRACPHDALKRVNIADGSALNSLESYLR
ncbi:MAG: 4Fe-4S dicluster domain-containing protein [Hyphomicrobiaceae bacterium]